MLFDKKKIYQTHKKRRKTKNETKKKSTHTNHALSFFLMIVFCFEFFLLTFCRINKHSKVAKTKQL